MEGEADEVCSAVDGGGGIPDREPESSRDVFERALGGKVGDYWELYEKMERDSVEAVYGVLGVHA